MTDRGNKENVVLTPNTEPEKRPWKFGCMTYFCVAATVIIVLAWFNLFRSVPLRVSPETTHITAPLTPDGRFVDYKAAVEQIMYPPEMKTDDNGFRMVLRAIGPMENSPPDRMQQRYEKVGLDFIRDKPTLTFRDVYDYFAIKNKIQPEAFNEIHLLLRENWRRDCLAMLEKHAEEDHLDAELVAKIRENIENHAREVSQRFTEQDAIKDVDDGMGTMPMGMGPMSDDYVGALLSGLNEEERASLDFSLTEFEFISSDSWGFWNVVSKLPDMHKLPLMQQWLAENNAALDLIVEASKKPVYVAPLVMPRDMTCLYEVLLPDIQSIRSCARGLDGRATIRVSEGDIDGAMEDILACYRLGRHTTRAGFLVQQLVGIACEGIAHDIAYNANLQSQADAEQLRRLLDGLNALPRRGDLTDCFEIERLSMLDFLTEIMKNPGKTREICKSLGFGTPYLIEAMTYSGLNWNLVLRRVNEEYDNMVAGTSGRVYPSPNPFRYMTLGARSEEFANIVIAMFLPATDACREAFRRLECADNLKRIQLAMFLYHAEHGTLPPAFSVDAEGKPLHGWRTLLLPYFGEETLDELYAQIRLDEPWDSEHNSQFHETNLDVYRCPSYASLKDGETSYAVVTGDGLLFTEDGQGQTLAGHGVNMLMVVERNDAACWMRPAAEVPQTLAETGLIGKGAGSVGSRHTGGANFVMRDGAVPFLSETINAEVFRNLIRGTAKERPQ